MSIRLSVSALRDYTFCGELYRLKRVERYSASEAEDHKRAAGKLMHSAYYYAHADPKLVKQDSGREVVIWEPLGYFAPERAKAMFQTLWQRDDSGLIGDEQDHYHALTHDLPVWSRVRFSRGLTKSLKAEDQPTLRRNWGEHYAEMLNTALELRLPGRVKEIERAIHYEVGGVQMLGFIDVVVELPSGLEGYIDLKTGWNKPDPRKLPFDLQQQLYYLDGPEQIWLWYLRHGLFEVPRNPEFIDVVTRTVPMTVSGIEAGYFRPRCDGECLGCDYLRVCYGGVVQ